MGLVEQWREVERSLPEGWGEARLQLTVADESQLDRAAALLGPLTPGRSGRHIRLFCTTRGPGARPDALRRLLARLDGEGIGGWLELLSTSDRVTAPTPERQSLAAAWQAELAALPPDWSDVYAEVELRSSDHVSPAALLMSPLNPARYGGGRTSLRFRCARRYGYGASPEMVRRCLERLDEERMTGEVRILRALSDTRPVQTQGPVWYVEGRSV